MRVAIFGYGFVGSALAHRLNKQELQIYDPWKGHVKKPESPDVAFVCVPAPTLEDGTVDLGTIKSVLQMSTAKVNYIKSTVLPGTCDSLAEETGKVVVACPEFLSRATARRDVFKQAVILGGRDALGGKEAYKAACELFQGQRGFQVSNLEAELVKHTHNTFAALKVNYFNLIYQTCQELGIDYSAVRKGVVNSSGYINSMHTAVPGPDGLLGFGGPCLPKDSKSFLAWLSGTENSSLAEPLREFLNLNKTWRETDGD